jgi:hypothetical protein
MKKVILLATAFMFVTGVALADKGKKTKKCAKGKTCCSKDEKAKAGCCKDKTTAKM